MVLRHAGKIIGDQANMLAELRALPAGGNRITILDMLHTNTLYVGMSEAVTQAKERFAGLRVEFVNMNDSGLGARQMVDAGKVDVAFETIISENPPTEPMCPTRWRPSGFPSSTASSWPAWARTSPLAAKGQLSLADLAQSRFILQANRYSERFMRTSSRCAARWASIPTSRSFPPTTRWISTPPTQATASTCSPRWTGSTSPHVRHAQAACGHPSFADKKRYVDAFALMDSDPGRPDLEYFAELLREHAGAVPLGGCPADA